MPSRLFPSLDTSPEPPTETGGLVRQGHRGLPNGHGIYDWSRRDGQALVAARIEEPFRHLGRDR
jgi:hypothetical protein